MQAPRVPFDHEAEIRLDEAGRALVELSVDADGLLLGVGSDVGFETRILAMSRLSAAQGDELVARLREMLGRRATLRVGGEVVSHEVEFPETTRTRGGELLSLGSRVVLRSVEDVRGAPVVLFLSRAFGRIRLRAWNESGEPIAPIILERGERSPAMRLGRPAG